MELILILVLSLGLSMLIIPIMWRFAPRLGLVDRPSARKVHETPMARVGGWGIVLGSMAPILIWAEIDPLMISYVVGSLTLLAFGTWDDSHEIGHYPKFVGQLLAVSLVVWYGDLYVHHMPFMEPDSLPDWLARVLSLIAMVGAVNAINHADGLDGLAGGESLLSLTAIVVLTYLAEGMQLMIYSLAVIGGVLGFMRFNTHPARLFMGDSGSQFIGFSLAVFVVELSQNVNPALSPVVPMLLLGLPVIDIVTVLAQRIYQGMNWFKASKNHVHHRILDFGFSHHEAVLLIYAIQLVFVVTGIVLRYESDLLLLGLYFAYAITLFYVLLTLKRRGWNASGRTHIGVSALLSKIGDNRFTTTLPKLTLVVLIPLYLLGGALLAEKVPKDFGVMSLLLAGAMVLSYFYLQRFASVIRRLAIYVLGVFVVFLLTGGEAVAGTWLRVVEIEILALITVSIAFVLRSRDEIEFRTTTMDYLIVFLLVTMGIVLQGSLETGRFSEMTIKVIVILYGCELLLNMKYIKILPITMVYVLALGILGVRGLLS